MTQDLKEYADIPAPLDIEEYIEKNHDGDNYRITEHSVQGELVRTFTYDSYSGVGFDLINYANGGVWLYLPFDEDYDEMILKDQILERLPEEYAFLLAGSDFTLLNSECGPGSAFIISEEEESWGALFEGEGYSLAARMMGTDL